MTKELEVTIRDILMPKYALIAYTQNTNIIFKYHDIINGYLGAGEPLTKSTAKNLFKKLNVSDTIKSFRGLIPKNVLNYKNQGILEILWINQPKKQYLYFDSSTNIKSGFYPIPKLIFKLKGTQLSVFSLLNNDEISLDTKLYFSPFLNVNEKGKICLGTASLNFKRIKFLDEVIEVCEKMFFNSVFTATHNNHLVKGNIISVLKENINKNNFEEKKLRQTKLQIKDLL